VQNRVIRLKPRSAPLSEAIDFYRASLFDDCLSALEGNASPEAQTLRIRALTRLGFSDAALDECSDREPGLSDLKSGELDLLKGMVFLRLGRAGEARESLNAARVAAYSSNSAALQAEYEAIEATLSFYERDLPGASAALDRALAVLPAQTSFNPDREYFLSLGLVRARAFDLRGLVARAKDGLRAQLHWQRASLCELDADPQEDQWLNATLLSNLALLVLDAGEPEFIDELRQRCSLVKWSDSTKLQRFNVVRSLGWLSALNGDHLNAFREFRASAELAPSRAWKLHAVLDRSFLARELDQATFADDELNYAIKLAGELDLSSTRDPSPPFSGLLKLAELAAERNAAEGRAILDRYRSARSKCPSVLFDSSDRRWQASELMAEAIVARAEGRTQHATDLLVNAFDAFDKLGSRWRAALAALELAAMTEEPFFFGYAAREANRRPQSWMARRLLAIKSD
jgi:hypothetical protein